MKCLKHLAFISYDGASFHGFAKNKHLRTIQDSIETVLLKSFGNDFDEFHGISFSSRTDAGVHALEHPISFNAPEYFSDIALKKTMNQRLPDSIRINNIETVSNNFDLRKNIEKKEYWYVISNSYPGVFLSQYSWTVHNKISTCLLEKLAVLLKGENDYKAFAKNGKKYFNTICNIESINIISLQNLSLQNLSNKKLREPGFPFIQDSDSFIISVIGNRFLHNQVRRMCGFMVNLAGNSKITGAEICFKNFSSLTNCFSNATKIKAPSKGLFLRKVWVDKPW